MLLQHLKNSEYDRGTGMYHYKSCGLDGIYLKNGYSKAVVDGKNSVSITALDSLHEAISINLCDLPRKLVGNEIRFLRIEMDMSQKALGILLEKTDQAIAKWEKGESEISRGDDVSLRGLYLESVNKDSKLGELLRRFNELDREIQKKAVFIEKKAIWHQVANG